MASTETRITLDPAFFGEHERLLVSSGELSASLFRYASGVCALRLKNARGQLIALPFQGQQIWRLELDGRELTMHSMFDEPRHTRNYLETYGGFLLHCGATAMGVPGNDDSHPLHGELPNAPYQHAALLVGEDAGGPYIGLTGSYQHTIAFTCNYLAEPLFKLYAGATVLPISLQIRNLMSKPLELMYLAHLNYRPVDGGRLIYSAPVTPEHVRVRKSIPPHVTPSASYLQQLDDLAAHPERHHVLAPGLSFDPEVVFSIDYQADEAGWAHSLHLHPGGGADYVAHRPEQLNIGVRWICRLGDQEALGFAMPATAEPEGYTAEKAKGNLKLVPPHASWRCDMQAGMLGAAAAAQVEQKIAAILGGLA